jgi:hypothetical protein
LNISQSGKGEKDNSAGGRVELGWEASRLNSSPGGRIANHILNRSAEGKRQKRNWKGISNSSFAFDIWDMDQPLVGRMGWFKKVQLSPQAWRVEASNRGS